MKNTSTNNGPNFNQLLTLVIAGAALSLSVVNYIDQSEERKANLAEDIPLLGFDFIPPGIAVEYGYFLENRGNRRASVKSVELSTVNEKSEGQAQKILDGLGFSGPESYLVNLGPNFSLPPRDKISFYTFTKNLDARQSSQFIDYVKLIKAEICYCDSQDKNCKIHIVSVDKSVIRRGSSSNKICS